MVPAILIFIIRVVLRLFFVMKRKMNYYFLSCQNKRILLIPLSGAVLTLIVDRLKGIILFSLMFKIRMLLLHI